MTHRTRGRGDDSLQLQLGFESPPRSAEELHDRLARLGLRGIERVRLTRNRAVMVSHSARTLRVHRGYLEAPPEVLRAIVVFVGGRTRAERHAARQTILAFPVRATIAPRQRRPGPVRPEDAALVHELECWHRLYNERYFGGRLRPIVIRLSSRMRSRLGQYTTASRDGQPAEIGISRAHMQRHGWAEVLHTLLHEMVHQWQAEAGHDIDHGPSFRAKAREVGIAARARRELRAASRAGRVVHPTHELLGRAARQE